jgi:hypothetical protein
LKEYDLQADAHLSGKTLYVSCVLDGLVGKDLGLQKETLDKLEGAMLSATRAALSTDAEVEFIGVKAKDSRLGVTVTLVRYFPDIKGLIYLRLSRSDFEDRLIMETESEPEPAASEEWPDISMTEFMARLAASRLHRQFTSNPLVSVFLQVHKVEGFYQDGTLGFRLIKSGESDPNVLMDEVLRNAVTEVVSDVVKKYDKNKIVRRVTLTEDSGRMLLNLEARDLLEKPKSLETDLPLDPAG